MRLVAPNSKNAKGENDMFKNNLKKILLVVLCLFITVTTLSACDGNSGNSARSTTDKYIILRVTFTA